MSRVYRAMVARNYAAYTTQCYSPYHDQSVQAHTMPRFAHRFAQHSVHHRRPPTAADPFPDHVMARFYDDDYFLAWINVAVGPPNSGCDHLRTALIERRIAWLLRERDKENEERCPQAAGERLHAKHATSSYECRSSVVCYHLLTHVLGGRCGDDLEHHVV
jgi:hypothetical protein